MTTRITKQMLNDAKMPDTPTARKVLAKMLDDDDIQDYVRPWVGLTNEERNALLHLTITHSAIDFAKACEAKLKEKNHG